MLSKNREVNVLSAARFFLFGARDIWFVVGVPVFLSTRAGLGFLAGRRLPRALGDRLRRRPVVAPGSCAGATGGHAPRRHGGAGAGVLARGVGGRDRGRRCAGVDPRVVLLGGLGAFGVVFAVNSVGALVPDPRVLRRGQGRDERRLLLHGQRRRAAAGHPALGAALSEAGLPGCLWASAPVHRRWPRGSCRDRCPRPAHGPPRLDQPQMAVIAFPLRALARGRTPRPVRACARARSGRAGWVDGAGADQRTEQ